MDEQLKQICMAKVNETLIRSMEKWSATHDEVPLTSHERRMFIHAFYAGAGAGVDEGWEILRRELEKARG